MLHPFSRVELIGEQSNVITFDFCHANAENNTHVVDMSVRMQGIDEKYDDVTAIEQDLRGDLYIAAFRSRQKAPNRSLGS